MDQIQLQYLTPKSSTATALPDRRRVLLVNRFALPDLSATSQMVGNLAIALAQHGHDVVLVASCQLHDNPNIHLPRQEELDGVQIQRTRAGGCGRSSLSGRLGNYVAFHGAATWAVATTARPSDIVVCLTDPPMLSVSLAPVIRARRAVLINWVQDLFPEVASSLGLKWTQGAVGQILQAARDRSLRAARMNVVLGEGMAARLAARGISPNCIRVIHNYASDARIWPVPAERNRLRSKWGLEGKFVVGYSGNLGRAHEFGTVLSAAEVLAGDPGTVFLIVGNGHYRKEMADAVAARNLPNVQFHPLQPISNLAHSLSAADVHVISLRPEAEGLIVPSKFYGIMAAGRPGVFVGDPDGEIARLLIRHRSGRSVRIGDVTGLVDALGKLRDDPMLCRALGANARAAFMREFNQPVAVEAWLHLLDEIGSGGHVTTTRAPVKMASTNSA